MKKSILVKAISSAVLIATLGSSMSYAAEREPNLGMSPLMEHMYNGNFPSQAEAQKLADELYYQRAVHAYMTMLPALNVIGMRDGSEEVFGEGYNVLPIWKDRMDSNAWVPTPNADVIYAMSYLDLKETGPLVVAAPAGVIGMFTDFFQRTLTDVGPSGPDKGKGGLYLLTPPGYDGFIPDGYYVYESSTYNVFLFFRMLMTQGEDGPDTSRGVAFAEKTSVYPLWDEEKNIKQMEFPNASEKRLNMMYPTDTTYWTKLKAFVDYEPIEAIDLETRGVLASIGIIKGKPFEPTASQQEMLEKAVDIAPKMILSKRMLGRKDKRNLYYHDRQYERIWAGGTSEWMQESYLDLDQRSAFFQFGYSSAPAMVVRAIDNGSKYPVTPRDSEGNLLSGENTYKMHLPAGIPAKLFWAVTAYNVTDGTMTATDQVLPSHNSFEDTVINEDGSIDMYFGPEKPDGVADTNFIKTVPGRNFLGALRLFGTSGEFFTQSWKPDDLVKIK